MSIDNINPSLTRPLGNVGVRREDVRQRTGQVVPRQSPVAPRGGPESLQAPAPARQAPGVVPTEAPPGTDPELWSVLTAEERAFFAKAGAMGPLTYGRMASTAPTPPVARGVRLDVRV